MSSTSAATKTAETEKKVEVAVAAPKAAAAKPTAPTAAATKATGEASKPVAKALAAPAEAKAAVKAPGPAKEAEKGASPTAAVEVRPEVKSTVTELAAEAAKAAAQPKAKAATPASKEAVKKDKPKAQNAGPSQKVVVIPAQVPSPSVFGVAASPATTTSTVMQEAAPGAEATFRQRPALSSTEPPPAAPRLAAAQSVGAAPSAVESGKKVAEAAAATGATRAVPAPPRAVEIVSRAPVKAGVAMPPTAVPVPENVAAVGPAAALTALAQPALKTVSPPAPATATAAAGDASKAGPASVPKTGPPALAVGRAVARGACPAVSMTGGKPVASIAKKYQIVFVSSEVAPWSKTGGLGEAMDGLPIALAALGHRVMTIAPRYDQYMEAWDTGYWSQVSMGSTTESVHAFHAYQSKVDRVFLDHDCFLSKVPTKTGSMLYGPEWGQDFADNQWRFTYFAKAAVKLIEELPLNGYPYGTDCIVIINDWHSSLVPVYLSMAKKAEPERWAGMKSALLIHNAVFQGRFDRDDPEEPLDEIYGLPGPVINSFTFNMPLKVGRTEPKLKRCLNWMAAGALYVDRVLTVSPTYAWELLNLPEMGVELDDIFAAKGMTGIVNGVKEGINPMNEAFVKKAMMLSTFGLKDVDEKKAELKRYVQELYGLPVSKESALCVFVGRMDLQKGYDYLLAALSAVLEELDLQIIVVGTGRSDLVASSKALAKKFPEKVYMAGWCGPERYALVAGADFNLMPSRWEPCGLAQMESMRFGTLPVVAQTGGLVDTVEDMLTGIHLGGAVSVEKELDPSSVELMARALERCVEVSADSEQMSKMRRAAMAAGSEFTWANAALQYEAVCEEMGAVDVLPLCERSSVTLETDKVVA